MDSVDFFEVLPKNWKKNLVGFSACVLCVIGYFSPGTRDAIMRQVFTTVNAHFQAKATQMSKDYTDSVNKAIAQSLPKTRVPVVVHP